MKTDGIKVRHKINLTPVHDYVGVFFEAVPDSNLVEMVVEGVIGHAEFKRNVTVGESVTSILVVEFKEADVMKGR
jgi:hypothetical protein